MTIATLLSWVQLRCTWEPSPRAGERANAKASTSHPAMAARVRKARKANRRRIRGSPRVTSISTVIVIFRGIWGHQQKDCWLRKRTGHQVNHVSQDGQAASCTVHQQTSSSSASAFPQTASTHGAIVHCGLEEDEDGWIFGVEGHEGAISDHFVGANDFSDHGRNGTRVELMVDSGSTATVCGLEHFSDTPVTIGPPMRLRASSGQPLKHYGQKKVELLSDSGEKMHVTFSVHDVKRAIISTSATAPSGIETHLD